MVNLFFLIVCLVLKQVYTKKCKMEIISKGNSGQESFLNTNSRNHTFLIATSPLLSIRIPHLFEVDDSGDKLVESGQ